MGSTINPSSIVSRKQEVVRPTPFLIFKTGPIFRTSVSYLWKNLRKEERKKRKKEHNVMSKFEEFWAMYPRRIGDNPKKPARTKFDLLVRDGIDPERIVAAAEVYRMKMQAERKFDTPFVPMARTWLHQHRFEDHAPKTAEAIAKIGDKLGGYVWNGSRWAETT